jgi:phosphoglycolate phosphatase-like HAD superfamily hydrolase
LHTHGARLVLGTLRQQQQVIRLLREHELSHLFSSVWGASDHQAAYHNHAHHKSDLLGKAIAHTRQRYGYSDRLACMIGDTEADVIAGQTHSIMTVALTCGIRSQTYLEQFEPDWMHSDLLAIAHRLIQQPRLVDCGFDRPQPSAG